MNDNAAVLDDPLVYLNGALIPISQASVSVLDRGFIFGDGIYEVIPIYQRRLFRAEQHLARLFRSLAAIGIDNPYDAPAWHALINSVADASPHENQMVYLQVTRGVAKRAHAFPADITPTIFIMSNPLQLPSEAARSQGVACVTMEDQRWLRCEIKSTSLLGNVLAAQNAVEHQAVESIQFRDGILTEASASNVWVVKNGRLLAPPKDNLILEGIRYGLVEELCATGAIDFEVRRLSRDEVFAADEVMLTSASKEILPVRSIDGIPIGAQCPGPIFKKLYASYQLAKAATVLSP